jgi:hypothetical protein
MSNIEGDGIMELMYYLLWRKDSPYKSHLNISIPDTIIFKKGKPVRWYFTNSEGTVLQKKIENINFENIIAKFLKGSKPNEIVGYFIRMELERDNNLNKLMKQGTSLPTLKILSRKPRHQRPRERRQRRGPAPPHRVLRQGRIWYIVCPIKLLFSKEIRQRNRLHRHGGRPPTIHRTLRCPQRFASLPF